MTDDKLVFPHIRTFDRLPDPPGERIVGHDCGADGDTYVEGYCGDDGVMRITRMVKAD